MNIKVEDQNLLDYSDWSTDLSGSTSDFTAVTGYNAQLNQYRQLDTDPFGNTNYIWVASGVTTTGSSYGGGYVSSGVTIDPTKTYRISQWCNRTNSGDTSNGFYFGYHTYNQSGTMTGTTRSDGAYSTNYYVYQNISANLSNINGWFLTTGYLMPYTWTGNTAAYQGKIYYNNGLTETSNAYNYKFNTNAKYLATRCYSPYNAPSYSGTKFCYPRIDLCDGTEPSINTLLTNEGMWRSGTTHIKVEDQNLLDYSDWGTDLSGSTSEFLENVDKSYNYRVFDTDPFGNIIPIWKSTTSGLSGWTGGIVAAPSVCGVNIDHTKMYRISIWTKRKIKGTNGSFYFGIRSLNNCAQDNLIRINDGLSSKNHYLFNANYSGLNTVMPEDTWILVVGYILPSTYTGGTDVNYYGKTYNINGINTGTLPYCYKFSGSTNALYFRTYGPYNEASLSASTYFCYPRIDLVDGTEPSIATLLKNEGMWRSGTTMIYVDDVWKNT